MVTADFWQLNADSYDLFLRHSLASGIVFLSVALDVENAVYQHFANLGTWEERKEAAPKAAAKKTTK